MQRTRKRITNLSRRWPTGATREQKFLSPSASYRCNVREIETVSKDCAGSHHSCEVSCHPIDLQFPVFSIVLESCKYLKLRISGTVTRPVTEKILLSAIWELSASACNISIEFFSHVEYTSSILLKRIKQLCV